MSSRRKPSLVPIIVAIALIVGAALLFIGQMIYYTTR